MRMLHIGGNGPRGSGCRAAHAQGNGVTPVASVRDVIQAVVTNDQNLSGSYNQGLFLIWVFA